MCIRDRPFTARPTIPDSRRQAKNITMNAVRVDDLSERNHPSLSSSKEPVCTAWSCHSDCNSGSGWILLQPNENKWNNVYINTNNQHYYYYCHPSLYRLITFHIFVYPISIHLHRSTCPPPVHTVSSLHLCNSASSIWAVPVASSLPASIAKSVSVIFLLVFCDRSCPNHIHCLSLIKNPLPLCVLPS